MGPLAWIFPGQGSQCVGMGVDAAARFPEVKQLFEETDEVLGEPLSRWMAEGPAEKLLGTVNAQPAILTVSCALAFLLRQHLPEPPAWLAGHSLGEYTALVLAGSLSFADAVRVVRARGRFMEAAAPAGTGCMAAVLGMAHRQVETLCQAMTMPTQRIEVANCNSPEQVVVAGHTTAVEAARERFLAAGARRVVKLPVSGPFHSSLLQPAAEQLAECLAGVRISEATIPVVANVTAKPMRGGRIIAERLAQQVASPVLWEQSMRYLLQQGVRTFVEIGPRSILVPLLRRMDAKLTLHSVTNAEELVEATEALAEPLAQQPISDEVGAKRAQKRARQERGEDS